MHSVDQWAVDHLMPGLASHSGLLWFHSTTEVQIEGRRHSVLRLAARLVAFPGSAWPSICILAILAAFAWRRRGALSAAAIVFCFGIAGAIEVGSKSRIQRPALYVERASGTYHLHGFDSSYPSGHALRALLLLMVATWLWPSARRWLLGWLGAALILLELGGFHTPSDILGGLTLGAALVSVGRLWVNAASLKS